MTITKKQILLPIGETRKNWKFCSFWDCGSHDDIAYGLCYTHRKVSYMLRHVTRVALGAIVLAVASFAATIVYHLVESLGVWLIYGTCIAAAGASLCWAIGLIVDKTVLQPRITRRGA